MNKLHGTNQGVTKILQLASCHAYWPGLKRSLEDRYLACKSYRLVRREGGREHLPPYSVPNVPFQAIGVNLFEFDGVDQLMIVDHLSKWHVVGRLTQTTARRVVDVLSELFDEYVLSLGHWVTVL